MQILVVVASTRLRALRTDVEKGSSSTAFERGLVGPKPPANAFSRAWRDETRSLPALSSSSHLVSFFGRAAYDDVVFFSASTAAAAFKYYYL